MGRGSALFVERFGELYRGSLATKGGGYPLLRVAARFLEMDYLRLIVAFRTVGGYAVLCKEPEKEPEPDTSSILNVPRPPTPAEAGEMIQEALG
jgi:hypothetical protein